MPATATARVQEQSVGVSTKELIDKIVAFCQALSGRQLYKYQLQYARRMIRSILENDGEEITALFARQSGKSQTVADITAGLCVILPVLSNMPMFCNDIRLKGFKEGFWIGIFAPTQNQSQLTYNKIRGVLLNKRHAEPILAELGITFNSNNGVTVSLTNGSFVTSRSASEGSNIEGESFMLIICEECQDISDYKIRKSIHPMGAAYNASIIKVGTCTTYRGDFYEAIQRNIKAYEEGKRGKNHFQYDYKVVMKYNPKYAKYIQKEMYRLGEDSDEFKLSYKLIWILERSMFVTSEYMNHNIYNKELDIVMGDKSARHIAGIDFGKTTDSTVITIGEPDWDNPIIIEKANLLENMDVMGKEEAYVAYKVVLKSWLEIVGDNYEDQYPLMMAFLNRFRLEKVVADATGVGAPIVDRLAANLPCEVMPYVYNTPSKSALYKHFNAELRGKRLIVPACDDLQETLEWRHFDKQMCELQKSYNGPYMVCQHPNAKDGHDDFPDSCALMLWGAKRPGLVKVDCTTGNPLRAKTSNVTDFYKARNLYTARRR